MMRNQRRQWVVVLGLLLITLLMPLSTSYAEDMDDKLFIIVNKSNSVNSISVSQLGRIFTKKTKQFENGVAALPIGQKNSRQVTSYFNKVILKKNAQQLKYYWTRKMFSGASKPPKALSSDVEVIKFVSSLKNAIGYVSKRPEENDDVKIIHIE